MKTSLAILFVLLTNHITFGQWSTNSATNNTVCTDYYTQNSIQMIPDGSGGAIITWIDYRLPSYSIFVQRINANGSNQWTTDGVQISPASPYGINSSITTDGSGGAIIIWQAGGSFGSIYAQHIASNGIIQWTTNGITVCSSTASVQWGPQVTADGNGGAILAWNDNRNAGNNDDVYAQRVDSSGVIQWAANGVAVATQPGYQGSLQLTSDGNGGAIIAWQDVRSGTSVDVYAQRVNGVGAVQWPANGVALASAIGGIDRYLQLTSDAGGAIICWQDQRNGTDLNIYAQKVNSNGVPQWTGNGVGACLATNHQQFPKLTTDTSGGAIICWQDSRIGTGGTEDIYAQRINSSGTVLWVTNGAAVCTQSNYQVLPQIAHDGNGGATITWTDGRSATNPNDVYAQRINANGIALWTTNGVGVSTATGNQTYPFIVNDGLDGMIISFQDGRKDPNRDDIYAQRLNSDGTPGRVLPLILSAPLRPDASRFQFTISGTAGRTYITEVSSNLTNWAAIATNVAPSDVFNYTNSNATNLTKFYRVKQGS